MRPETDRFTTSEVVALERDRSSIPESPVEVDSTTGRHDEPRQQEAEQPATTFSPLLIVIAALLVILGTRESTRPFLLFLGVWFVLTVVHLGGFALTGLLARTRLEAIEVFFGRKIAVLRVKDVPLSIGWLPLGGSVRFQSSAESEREPKQGYFSQLPLAWRSTIHASGPLALLLLACLCIGSEEAVRSLLRGFSQVVEGAIAPLSLGQTLVRKAIELPQREGLVVAIGVLATKLAAANLLPFPPMNGGQLLMELLPTRFRESRGLLLMYLGLLCILGIAAGWCIAFCKFAIVTFQGG